MERPEKQEKGERGRNEGGEVGRQAARSVKRCRKSAVKLTLPLLPYPLFGMPELSDTYHMTSLIEQSVIYFKGEQKPLKYKCCLSMTESKIKAFFFLFYGSYENLCKNIQDFNQIICKRTSDLWGETALVCRRCQTCIVADLSFYFFPHTVSSLVSIGMLVFCCSSTIVYLKVYSNLRLASQLVTTTHFVWIVEFLAFQWICV